MHKKGVPRYPTQHIREKIYSKCSHHVSFGIYVVALIDLVSVINSRSTGTGNNIKRLHNTVGGKQRHLRVWSNISLFHNFQNLKY